MMWQVPGSMHEPCDTCRAIRTQAQVDHRCCQNRIDKFPNAKRSSDYAPTAPAAKMALKLRRAGWGTSDMLAMKQTPPRNLLK